MVGPSVVVVGSTGANVVVVVGAVDVVVDGVSSLPLSLVLEHAAATSEMVIAMDASERLCMRASTG